MLTKEQIQQMFEDMGFYTEEDKSRFLQFTNTSQEQPSVIKLTFTFAFSDTSFEEEVENGELERDSQ